jgi:molybdopterin-containing oxidoreductase family membrane subunit
MLVIGIIINIGMWLERYIIIPGSLTINRMPFTWRLYFPRVEVFLTIGTFALFILLYMLASRLIPLVPAWEVQEGQLAHTLRKFGKTHVASKAEIE